MLVHGNHAAIIKGPDHPTEVGAGQHHWTPGTELSIEDTKDGVLLRPFKTTQPTRLDDVVGSLRVQEPAHTLQEMDSVIGDEVRARHDRGRY